jgi:predicted GNAT family acetyltransferase
MDFIHESNRIYKKDMDGKVVAEVTFPSAGNDVVNINHTFVDGSLRGQGIAGKLMEETADQLRKEGKKAVLTCSYAISWFEKNEQYKDLLNN